MTVDDPTFSGDDPPPLHSAITQEEILYFVHLTTEQQTFYLYEVKCSRGNAVSKALIEALFLFLDRQGGASPPKNF